MTRSDWFSVRQIIVLYGQTWYGNVLFECKNTDLYDALADSMIERVGVGIIKGWIRFTCADDRLDKYDLETPRGSG